jgi:hypothetical protein
MLCRPALLCVLLLAPVLATVGCVTQYSPPKDEAGATASLLFLPNRGGRGTSEKLSLVNDARCNGIDAGGGIRLSTQNAVWRKTAPIIIKAGARLYLRAQGDTIGRPISNRTCINISSFEPQPGHVYEVQHSDTSEGCRLAVRDRATGAPPPSLMTHPVGDQCVYLPVL